MEELIIGEEIIGNRLNKIFGDDNIHRYGKTLDRVIGETFLICKDPKFPNHVWSFILIDLQLKYTRYRLIYKYTG